MSKKIEIIGTALTVTDTVSGIIEVSQPAKDFWYKEVDLQIGRIAFFDANGVKGDGQIPLEFITLSSAVDSGLVAFNETTFRAFCTDSLGKSSPDEAVTSLPYGGATAASNVTATVIAVIGTYVPVAATFVAGMLKDMTADAAGKITYTETISKHFHIVSNFDITTASNNQTVAFQWFKNGVAISVPVERLVSTGADIGAMSVHADALLATNDYLELRATNLTTASNITCKNVYLFVVGMPV